MIDAYEGGEIEGKVPSDWQAGGSKAGWEVDLQTGETRDRLINDRAGRTIGKGAARKGSTFPTAPANRVRTSHG